jgi:hypothetical protein
MIYVPTNVAKAYQQALAGGSAGANGWNNMMNVGEKPMNFNGIDLAMCPGLPASAMVAAQKSNLILRNWSYERLQRSACLRHG